MGSIRSGTLREFVLWLRDTLNFKTFVEPGTNLAETTVWAARKVVTIEGYEPLYKRAVESFGTIQNIGMVTASKYA